MPELAQPTEDELAKLPRWARVAFAARCARRAQRLMTNSEIPPNQRSAVIEKAIRTAERAAARADSEAYEEARLDASIVTKFLVYDTPATTTKHAAAAAAAAAHAATTLNSATSKAGEAVRAAVTAGVPTSDLRADFDLLVNHATAERWRDDTRVSPAVFPPIVALPPVLEFPPFDADVCVRAYVRDGVAPDVAKQELLALFNAMNDFTIAKFGKSLAIKDFQEHVLAAIPARVLS